MSLSDCKTRFKCALFAAFSALVLLRTQPLSAQEQPYQNGIASPSSCEESLQGASLYNSLNLSLGIQHCFKEGNTLDGTFLLFAFQVRSITDLRMFQPMTDVDVSRTASIYNLLYYKFGGLGDANLYEDTELSTKLFAKFSTYQPLVTENYDPGWAYPSSVRHTLYREVARENLEKRLAQLKPIARLRQNTEYAALQRELDTLARENNNTYKAGSAELALRNELLSKQNKIKLEIEARSPTPEFDSRSVLDSLKPELPAGIRNLFGGLNGPEQRSVSTFRNADDLRTSWVGETLSMAELETLLGAIDFSKEVVFALAHGDVGHDKATGTMDPRYVGPVTGSWYFSYRIGVNQVGCENLPKPLHPFVLLAVPSGKSASYDYNVSGYANFSDECSG